MVAKGLEEEENRKAAAGLNWTVQQISSEREEVSFDLQGKGLGTPFQRHSAYANKNVFPIRRTNKRMTAVSGRLVAAARHSSYINPGELVTLPSPEITDQGVVVVSGGDELDATLDSLDVSQTSHELKSLLTTRHLVGKLKGQKRKK